MEMTACLERAGLVTGKRTGPVCGPLRVLKLRLGAFNQAPKPNNIHVSEIKELLDGARITLDLLFIRFLLWWSLYC